MHQWKPAATNCQGMYNGSSVGVGGGGGGGDKPILVMYQTCNYTITSQYLWKFHSLFSY